MLGTISFDLYDENLNQICNKTFKNIANLKISDISLFRLNNNYILVIYLLYKFILYYSIKIDNEHTEKHKIRLRNDNKIYRKLILSINK